MKIGSGMTVLIGITGYVLLFIFFGWKMCLCIFVIHWAVNCERNIYIDKKLTEMVEILKELK